MDIQFSDIRIPDFGYDLIRQIKELEGRQAFLDDWSKEIKQHVQLNDRKFDKREITVADVGSRRLRVVRHKPTQASRFDYAALEKSVERKVFQQYVRKIPPKFPRTIRLAAPMPRQASKEWAALAKLGTEAEAMSPDWAARHAWQRMSPEKLTEGLFFIGQQAKVYKTREAELREALTEMANECEWESGLAGRGDGRLMLPAAKPKFEAVVDREDLLRRFPKFVKYSNRPGYTVVGFFAIGEDTEE